MMPEKLEIRPRSTALRQFGDLVERFARPDLSIAPAVM